MFPKTKMQWICAEFLLQGRKIRLEVITLGDCRVSQEQEDVSFGKRSGLS